MTKQFCNCSVNTEDKQVTIGLIPTAFQLFVDST